MPQKPVDAPPAPRDLRQALATRLKDLAQVQQESAQLAQRQQQLQAGALRLQGAIHVLEELLAPPSATD